MMSFRRSKKKKAKNSMQNKKWFVIRFIIGMLIIQIYYFQNYFLSESFIKKCQMVSQEMNLSAQIEPYYWIGLNTQRELFSNPLK